MSNRTVAAAIHGALVAAENCHKSGNREWLDRWAAYVTRISRELLPSGSGFNNGTRILELTKDKRGFILRTAFHHMNEHGYDGWTEHAVTVRAAFNGVDIVVSGKDRNDIKDYIAETMHAALSAAMPEGFQP